MSVSFVQVIVMPNVPRACETWGMSLLPCHFHLSVLSFTQGKYGFQKTHYFVFLIADT